MFISFIIIFFVLGGIYCNAQDGGSLPDELKILKEKIDKQEIPTVDFSKIKFEFPETMPDELSFIKGYLCHGQHFSPVNLRGVVFAYLFLVSFNKETREISFFRAYEKTARVPSGWGILSGRFDLNNNRKIALQAKDGGFFVLIINDKDHLTVKAPNGFEAQMTKMVTISPPK